MNVVLSLYSNIRVSHVNAQEPIYYVSGSLWAVAPPWKLAGIYFLVHPIFVALKLWI